MKNGLTINLCLLLTLLVLMAANIGFGSVSIPLHEVVQILTGHEAQRASWEYIIWESRIPQMLTATLCGASLSIAGLLLQTAFRNPLAGPSILGITNGAGLGVGIVMLITGGAVSMGGSMIVGYMAVIIGAFIGAMAVIMLLLIMTSVVRGNMMLLIVGIMISYLASSLVMMLNFFATADNIHSYVMWGMGSFSDVSPGQLPFFAVCCLAGLLLSVLLIKPLNALLLGDAYAQNLGVNITHTRILLLTATGLLTAAATAFCGPVAFIGLAVPHIARLLTRTANHQVLLPATALCGAIVALACNIVCVLPANSIIPLNAVTPIFGAPVIIYIMCKKN